MKQNRYKVNEIFYSLQGEGARAGKPAVFIRLSGCNLKCAFCDTDHDDGIEYTASEILSKAERYEGRSVIFTGGEPSIQLDRALFDKFEGWHRAIETNGTREISLPFDWRTVSPKGSNFVQRVGEELKVIINSTSAEGFEVDTAKWGRFNYYFLQPDYSDLRTNIRLVTSLCLANPAWRASFQVHKFVGVR